MINLKKIIILLVLFFGLTSVFSQKVTAQAIEKPKEGKSLVYIANVSTRKFDIYDSKNVISNIKSRKYNVVEIETGKHLFWLAKNPSTFVEADLAPNNVYVLVIEEDDSAAVGGMFGALGSLAGSAMAGGNLRALNPEEFKDKRLFYQVIKNMTKENILISDGSKDEAATKEMQNKAFEKYDKLKSKNDKKILHLTPEMKFENADKPVKQ